MLTQVQQNKVYSELKTLEWWISGLMLGPLLKFIHSKVPSSEHLFFEEISDVKSIVKIDGYTYIAGEIDR